MSVRFSGIDSYHILDTKPSEQFDRLTQLAVKICKADAAFVSLIDRDRQWFKSRVGFEQTEAPFSNSICQYLITKNLSHLYIPDLSADEVFRENLSYTQFGVMFYAGFPLLAPDKSILGSFCVVGFQPQTLDEVQLEFLQTMADQSMVLIESHKLNYELSIEAARLEKRRMVTDKAAVIGKLGGFYVDLSGQDIFWTHSNNVLFNLKADYSMTFEEFESGSFKIENSTLPIFEKLREISVLDPYSETKFSFAYEADEKMIEVLGELIDHELYVTFQDISDQYKLNHELTLYRTLMEQVEEMVNMGGWSYDLNTEEIFWTKNTYAIYGLPNGQKINLNQAKSYFSGESFDELHYDFSNLVQSGTPYQKEYLFTSANGKIKWVKASGHPIYTDGVITRVVGSFQDISEEKRLREHLQKSELEAVHIANYYKSLVNNPTFYICKAGVDRILTFCNDLYANEVIPSELEHSCQGIDLFHAVKPDYLDYAKEAFSAITSGADSKRRVLLKETNRDQVETSNLWDFIGIKNSQDELYEVLCLGYDVSELEENRTQVQLLADYTAFQNKKILEYNSIVSHDIRSHVANAIGLISLMDLVNDQDEYQNYFRLLKKEIRKTDRTIVALDKLTSSTSIFESGKEPISLYHLIEQVFGLLKRAKPHARFVTVNKIPVDLIIFSIREYLENVFLNVFSNSLKFISPERELQIEIFALQITNSILQIKITDNGVGVDMKEYEEELFKIQRPLKNTQYGNGIGLYLVKKQIEALGGRVDIESENNKGTTIVLEFLNYED